MYQLKSSYFNVSTRKERGKGRHFLRYKIEGTSTLCKY